MLSYSSVFVPGLQLRVAHDISNSREVQLHARVKSKNDLVRIRANELALLRVYARFGAMKSSALRI
jgi:hypothetical protein